MLRSDFEPPVKVVKRSKTIRTLAGAATTIGHHISIKLITTKLKTRGLQVSQLKFCMHLYLPVSRYFHPP